MTKISNKTAYGNENPISDNDFILGTNGDSISKETKSFQAIDLRNYLLAGLAPIAGGTLKITEIVYTGVLVTPEAVANQISSQFISPYEVVIFSVNSNKYQLKKQNGFIGTGQIALVPSDFITLSLIAKNLSASISTYKGLNVATGREEHYSIGSVGFSITKELDGSLAETGRILLEQISQTNLGTGIAVYKGFNATTKLQEFKTLLTDNLEFTETANTIKINTPTLSEVPSIIVNSSYAGVSTGSLSKPFKTIQEGLDYFVGGSPNTNLNPLRSTFRVVIQKGSGYTFTGHFEYNNLSLIIEEGTFISSNPTGQDWLIDLDKYGDVTFDITINRKENSVLTLSKSGFRNRGTTINTPGIAGAYKSITLIGQGSTSLSTESFTSPAVRTIFDSNSLNLAGYFNRGDILNFTIRDGILFTPNSRLIASGGNSIVRFYDVEIISGGGNASEVNQNTKFMQFLGNTQTEFNNCIINTYFNIGSTRFNYLITISNSIYLFMAGCKFVGSLGGFLDILSNTCSISILKNLGLNNGMLNFLNSTIPINNIVFDENNISQGTISANIDLTANNTRSVTNTIQGVKIESLVRRTARTGGLGTADNLPIGAAFINTNGNNPDTAFHRRDIKI